MNRRILCVVAAAGLPLAACAAPESEFESETPNLTQAGEQTQAASQLRRVNLHHAPALWAKVAQQGLSNTALGLDADEGFRTLRERTGVRGLQHARMQQTYRGIPIWGEHIITTHDASGKLVRMHGELVQGLGDIDVTPSISSKDALAQMKASHERKAASANAVYENESSELVIYANKDLAKLAYEVSFFADARDGGHPTRPTFLVDAKSGEVLFQYEGLTTDSIGTGAGGNAKTGQYEYGTDFGFNDVAVNGSTCTMNNSNVKTVNLNHGSSGSTAFSYTCPRNTVKEINGAYSPLNDAHFFGGVVFDMYDEWIGSAPLSFQLTMRVHYSTNYENAFWNGSSMTFGDGATTFHPLVSLDVSSHEVSHGFTEQNSGLIYSNQSGGINEAFSDIAGEAAENYMHGDNDFEVGADIFKAPGALRYMYDPPLDGSSIGHADDYFGGMNVHYSSGVYNKAFYLIATSEGWSVQQAFQVFAYANQNYWGPSTDYAEGADGVRSAATDLGFELDAIDAAFDAVGVVPPVPPEPSCTDPVDNCVDVTLDLLTDNYASETSWRITRASTGATVATGSGYSNNTPYTETTPLDPGDYIFTILDSFGDGICCAYGTGSYELSSEDGTVIAAGGEFASSESTAFTIDGNGPPDGPVVLSDDDFESGLQGWSLGGGDARRNARDSAYASEGTYCVRLRDDSGDASSLSKAYDLSAFASVNVSFNYYARSMESGEDFFVEAWDGSAWNTVANYVVDQDFSNNAFHTADITFDASAYGADAALRIRADASTNTDYIFVDEVVVIAE